MALTRACCIACLCGSSSISLVGSCDGVFVMRRTCTWCGSMPCAVTLRCKRSRSWTSWCSRACARSSFFEAASSWMLSLRMVLMFERRSTRMSASWDCRSAFSLCPVGGISCRALSLSSGEEGSGGVLVEFRVFVYDFPVLLYVFALDWVGRGSVVWRFTQRAGDEERPTGFVRVEEERGLLVGRGALHAAGPPRRRHRCCPHVLSCTQRATRVDSGCLSA